MKYCLPFIILNRQEKMRVNAYKRKGYIMLYNKNANTFSYWKIIRKAIRKYAYVVERYNCPRYWSKSILKLN